jgi:hypothetical protein
MGQEAFCMASRKPILIFDTSVVNRLASEPEFPAIAAGLRTAYWIRLTESNISELVATSDSDTRNALLGTCQRLLASGDCIDPFNLVVEKHTKEFDQNPAAYDWTRINVQNRDLETAIVDRTLFDDELAEQQRNSARETNESFEDMFNSTRADFDAMFAAGEPRPSTFAELVNNFKEPGGAFWGGYARRFYERSVATVPTGEKVRDFGEKCPPFMLMVLAVCMAQYKRVIVAAPRKEKRAGRVDLLMSVYLAYCRIFVTHDYDQQRCLREIATIASLDTKVLLYEDFRSRLLPPVIES